MADRRPPRLARLTLAALLGAAILAGLTGCKPGRLGQLPSSALPRDFASPLQPVGSQRMGPAEVASTLRARRSDIKSVRGNGSLVLGGSAAGRQSFDLNVVIKYPDTLRVRGTQTSGAVFDVLMKRGDLQAVVYPERTAYHGRTAELRANPAPLMGIDPTLLLDAFEIETVLLDRLERYPGVSTSGSSGTHYSYTFLYTDGTGERFLVRTSDLLVQRYERLRGGRSEAAVTYAGFRQADGGTLVPTGFVTDVAAAGGQFAVTTGELHINEKAPEQAFTLPVPEGFRRAQLGG